MRSLPSPLRFALFALVLMIAIGGLLLGSAHHRRAVVAPAQSPTAAGSRVATAGLPLLFERAADGDGYVARGAGYGLAVTRAGAAIRLRVSDASASVRMRFGGARPVTPVAEQPLPTRTNDFLGNDPSRWRTDVATFGAVRLPDLYPGIDAVFYGYGRQLEYDLVVSPGRDVTAATVAFDGADAVRLNDRGDLVVTLHDREIQQRKPIAYQTVNGARRTIAAEYVLADGHVAFAVGEYDRSRPLVIDPVVVYSTYFGGTDHDEPAAITTDSSGNAYIVGTTISNLPSTYDIGPGSSPSAWEAFILKLNRDGQPMWLTTFGGTNTDAAEAVAVDRTGSAYIFGRTSATDFPTTAGAYQRVYRGGVDAFLVKLAPAGNALVYGTYFGGSGGEPDLFADLAVDERGNAYVTGTTTSADLPVTSGVIDTTNVAGNETGFVTKFNASGTALVYSTYLTGTDQQARAIALDSRNRVVIGGSVVGSMVNKTFAGSWFKRDAFVMQLNENATGIVYSIRFGGEEDEMIYDLALDSAGSAHVTGFTRSTRFPVVPDYAPQTTLRGSQDAFVATIYSNGNFGEGTYLGGSGAETGTGIAVADPGVVTVTGQTQSSDFPLRAAVQGYSGNVDSFVAQIYGGFDLRFSTYVGGSDNEFAHALAVDSAGTMTIVGETLSRNYPTKNAFQPAISSTSGWDTFITRLAMLPRGTAGADDIVVNVADAATLHGNWAVESDATAAGGKKVRNPDAGLPKVATALAAPTDYFEFTVPIGQQAGPYHVWVRGKADKDNYNNDSVYLQFSYADNGSDEPTQYFPIGSAQGMAVVLEDCNSCGVHGWAWQDDVYGPGRFTNLYFRPNSPLTVRVQRREDGISIDQIVFAPEGDQSQTGEPYFLWSPGYQKDDDTILAAGAADVVLWSGSDGLAEGHGAWAAAGDPTAAGGGGMRHPDAGAAKLAAPLADPVNYFEMEFPAIAHTPYRLWLRGKADRDSWNNDSVFVQFSDSVSATGQAQWRTGTTSATAVVIEECSGCGLQGWGWADNGYGMLGPLVYFAETGTHRIRIQTREDGLTIDQIVLSPQRYLTAAPGATKNDTTIVTPSNPAQLK